MDRKPDTMPKVPQTKDEKLDDALDDSFPASDPPSMTDPQKHVGNVTEEEQKKPKK